MSEIKDMITFLQKKGLISKPFDIDLLAEEYNRLVFDRIHGLSNIVAIVCYHSGVKEQLLKEKTRKREVVQARQISMYFMHKYTQLSLQSIGDYFYNPIINHVFDHATCIYSCGVVENLMQSDKYYRKLIEKIERYIKIKLNIMKPSKITVSISIPEELGEEIECNIEYHIENNGIGSYEFWGFKGNDVGQDSLEIDNIEPIFTDQSEDIKSSINKYIDDNIESVSEDICLKIDKIKSEYDGDI